MSDGDSKHEYVVDTKEAKAATQNEPITLAKKLDKVEEQMADTLSIMRSNAAEIMERGEALYSVQLKSGTSHIPHFNVV